MNIALDVGAYRLRSLGRDGRRLIAHGCRSLYSALPDSETARRLLKQVSIHYAFCDDRLVLIGDAAAEFSRLFQSPCLPLFPEGRLPQNDPPARQIIGSLFDALMPEPASPYDICGLTIPVGCAASLGEQGQDHEFLTRLVRLRGYIPLVLTPGMAIVLAELVKEAFTGIGLVFGGASREMVLAHRGVEISRSTVPLGGQWIDEELARQNDEVAWDSSGRRYLDTESARRWKESRTASLLTPGDDRALFLEELYRELVAHVINEGARRFAEEPVVRDLRQPVVVVAAGGPTRIPGFADLLRKTWKSVPFPLATKAIRLADDSDYTIARGCLINAELESESASPHATAA